MCNLDPFPKIWSHIFLLLHATYTGTLTQVYAKVKSLPNFHVNYLKYTCHISVLVTLMVSVRYFSQYTWRQLEDLRVMI